MENQEKYRLFYTYNGKDGIAPSKKILDTYKGLVFDEHNRVIYANKKPYGGGVSINSDELKDLIKQNNELKEKLESIESEIEEITTDITSVANRPIKATHQELVLMSKYGQLSPGTKYQLTDYECVVDDGIHKSAGHRFDLIITANTPTLLNHECSATYHDFTDEIKQKEDELDELQELINNFYNDEFISEKITEYEAKKESLIAYENELKEQQRQLEDREDFNENNNDDAYELAVLKEKHNKLTNIEFTQLYRFLDLYCDIKENLRIGSDEDLDETYEKLENERDSVQEELYKLSDELEYFDYCNLNVWKIWYLLEYDEDRDSICCEWYGSGWDNPENGKGVIYRMIDEYNNDVGYDFKNILIPAIKLTYNNIDEYFGNNGSWWYNTDELNFYKNIFEYIGPWNFYIIDDGYSKTEDDVIYCYTFNDREEDTTVMGWSGVYNNTIVSHEEEPSRHDLPNVIYNGEFIFNNYVGPLCRNIILNEMCAYNEVIYECNNIYIGEACVLNKITNEAEMIYIGDYCARNVFENENNYIILSEYCVGNTFDVNSRNISLYYDESSNNKFGLNNRRIELYESASNNIFKDETESIECYAELNDCTFEEITELLILPEVGELHRCYLYNVPSLDPEMFEDDNREYDTSTLHIEGYQMWSDEGSHIVKEYIDDLYEYIDDLEQRIKDLEDNFEDKVNRIIETYKFRTVCKYDIRGTGNINIVAANSLQNSSDSNSTEKEVM